MIYDLIIIGAGPVGLYSTFISGYMKLKTLCVEIDDQIGGQPYKLYPNKYIYDFPGYEKITGKELIDKLYSQIQNYKNYCEIKTKINLVSYYIENDIVHLIDSNGKMYKSKFVLICSGIGSYITRKIDNNIVKSHKNITYNYIDNDFYYKKNIVVLGGGDGAIDYAKHIKQECLAKTVCLIHHKPEFTSKNQNSEDLKDIINIYLDFKIDEIYENHLFAYCNKTNNKIKFDFDNILVQYGYEFKLNSFFAEFKKNEYKRLEVNDFFQTSNKYFFAAGSCLKTEYRIDMIITGISEATIALNKIKSLLPKSEKIFW